MTSFMRNVNATRNSITQPMQTLADGGGLYTNAPCSGCHVSQNYFEGDPTVYGCLYLLRVMYMSYTNRPLFLHLCNAYFPEYGRYHDGGSGLWSDYDNVFNHIQTAAVFCHGGSGGITVDGIYMNDSGLPSLQGATNMKLRNGDGVCVLPNTTVLAPGEAWSGVAAEVVAQAGRRLVDLPPLVVPALTAAVNESANNAYMADLCVRFAALPCVAGKASQRWHLMSGVKPGDGKPTTIRSAIPRNATCIQVENGARISDDYDSITNGAKGGCKSELSGPDGCKTLPPADGYNGTNACDYDQAFVFNANGTVALCKLRRSAVACG